MIRPWSENDPTTHETVSHPSHRTGRSSTFGDKEFTLHPGCQLHPGCSSFVAVRPVAAKSSHQRWANTSSHSQYILLKDEEQGITTSSSSNNNNNYNNNNKNKNKNKKNLRAKGR